jgi:DNA-binding Xre family transcriptional regulator
MDININLEQLVQGNIKKILVERGISQNKLAKDTGIPAISLNEMLKTNGKMKLKLHTIETIASALSVPVSMLISKNENKNFPEDLVYMEFLYLNNPNYKAAINYFHAFTLNAFRKNLIEAHKQPINYQHNSSNKPFIIDIDDYISSKSDILFQKKPPPEAQLVYEYITSINELNAKSMKSLERFLSSRKKE